jgi:hypothetical protein
MGRQPVEVVKIFNRGKKDEKHMKVKLFPWEELNALKQVKRAFNL